jgi:hypothetical protein
VGVQLGLSHTEGGTQAEGVQEQGAVGQERVKRTGDWRNCIMKSSMIKYPYKILLG